MIPNVYFANCGSFHVQVQICLADRLQLAFTELGIVLKVNDRDGMIVSWSAHFVGCIVPFLFLNIEFED